MRVWNCWRNYCTCLAVALFAPWTGLVALPPSAINGYCGQRGSSYYLNITWLPAMNVTAYQITYLDLDHGTNSRRFEDCYVGPCYALIDVDMKAKHWNICIASYNQGNILGLQNCQEIDCVGVSSGGSDLKFLAFIILVVPIVLVCPGTAEAVVHVVLGNTES
ncbi:hypothetical protein EMCRGX_G009124 [Ephydatia muelleri]